MKKFFFATLFKQSNSTGYFGERWNPDRFENWRISAIKMFLKQWKIADEYKLTRHLLFTNQKWTRNVKLTNTKCRFYLLPRHIVAATKMTPHNVLEIQITQTVKDNLT